MQRFFVKSWNRVKHRLDIINLVVSLTSLIMGIILTVLAMKYSEEIAARSGAFDRPGIKTFLGASSIPLAAENRLVIGYPEIDSAIVVGALPLLIWNSGTKSLKDLRITFRYPKWALRSELTRLTFVTAGPPIIPPMDRTLGSDESYEYQVYRMHTLEPGATLTLHDPLFLLDSRPRGVKQDTTSNSQESPFPNIPWHAVISISAEDYMTVDHLVRIERLPAANSAEFRNAVESLVVKEATAGLKGTPFIERFWLSLKGREDTVLVTLPSFETTVLDDGLKLVVTENTSDSVGSLIVEPFSFTQTLLSIFDN